MEAENTNSTTFRKYSITELLGNKIKPTNERFGLWLLTENLNNSNLVTNIGDIIYTNGEQKLEEFKQITEPFCDNIMVVKIADFIDCEGDLKNGKFLVKKEACGSFNSFLRSRFSNFKLPAHGVKAKLPYLLKTDSKTNNIIKGVKQIIKQDMEFLVSKYKNPVVIPYKIELADVKLKTLLKELPEILEELKKEHYYLLDFDITQDFAGIFNKEEMIEYLTNNFSFRIQGEYKEECNIIIKNNNSVGIDCLTWLNSNSRVKIYNKFICQLTSPGINKQLGNHIIDFLNCPDKRLKETFASDLAKQNGITRLEATIYNYTNENFQKEKEFNPIQDCATLLKDNKEYFQNAPFYSVPFAKMWEKLTDSLQTSCCLVFKDILQYVYWGNRKTKKLTGIQVRLPENREERNKLIMFALSAFSFNYLPVNYLEIIENVQNPNIISIDQKCFIKSGETYFSKSNSLFSTISKNINIEELGLIATKNVIPFVSRKRINISNKLYPCIIKEIKPINLPYLQSTKKREQEFENLGTQQRKLEYLDNTVAIKEEYKHILEKEQEIKETEEEITNYFSKRWKDLDINNCSYKIYAFVINNKNKFPYVGALCEKDGIKSVYYIKGELKNKLIDASKNREGLKEEGFVFIPYNTLEIIYFPAEKPFMEIKVNGTKNYNGNSYPNIQDYNLLDVFKTKENNLYNQEIKEQIENTKMGEIIGKVKVLECARLESLEEGTELIISSLTKVGYRGKERYIFKFDNVESCYVTNYWLEKEIQDRKIDLNYKLKLRIDKIKTTPNKNKERLVFIV